MSIFKQFNRVKKRPGATKYFTGAAMNWFQRWTRVNGLWFTRNYMFGINRSTSRVNCLPEVLATGGFTVITGGEGVLTVSVDEVQITSVAHSPGTPISAIVLAAIEEINNNTTSPNYTAYQIQGTPGRVMIQAVNNTGSTPNGFIVDVVVSIDIAVNDITNMFGGAYGDALILGASIPNPWNEVENTPITPYDASAAFIGETPIYYELVNDPPSWMVIDPLTGIITGTPDATGTTSGIKVKATNACGELSSGAFDVIVTGGA